MRTRIANSPLGIWWADATLKQKLVFIISAVIITTSFGYGVYAFVRGNDPVYQADKETKQDVNVADITDKTKSLTNKAITTMTTKKEVDPETYTADPEVTPTESNVSSTPTESTQGEDYYVSGGNGGRYEYEQVDPAIENPDTEPTHFESDFSYDSENIIDASDGALNPWDDGNWQFEDNSSSQ